MRSQRPGRLASVFLATTLGLSLLVFWGPIALARVPTISFVGDTRGPIWAIILFMIGGFVPSLLAIAMSAITDGRAGVRALLRRVVQFRLGWAAYAATVLVVVIGSGGQVLVALAVGGSYDPSPILAQLGSLVPLIVIGPLSEELGWRGYAQEHLQRVVGPLVASLVVGVVWGLWHLPLFFIVGSSQSVLGLPFPSFLVGTTAISVVFGWLYNLSNRSIWSAVFLHWLYTYALQAISSGVERTPLYNWLEYAPYVLIAIVVAALWRRGRSSDQARSTMS